MAWQSGLFSISITYRATPCQFIKVVLDVSWVTYRATSGQFIKVILYSLAVWIIFNLNHFIVLFREIVVSQGLLCLCAEWTVSLGEYHYFLAGDLCVNECLK